MNALDDVLRHIFALDSTDVPLIDKFFVLTFKYAYTYVKTIRSMGHVSSAGVIKFMK